MFIKHSIRRNCIFLLTLFEDVQHKPHPMLLHLQTVNDENSYSMSAPLQYLGVFLQGCHVKGTKVNMFRRTSIRIDMYWLSGGCPLYICFALKSAPIARTNMFVCVRGFITHDTFSDLRRWVSRCAVRLPANSRSNTPHTLRSILLRSVDGSMLCKLFSFQRPV